MKKNSDQRIIYSSFAIRRYLYFFVVLAFILTTSFLLFFSALEHTSGLSLTGDTVEAAALYTFLNVFVLSACLTIYDYVSSLYRISRPVKKILKFTDQLAEGGFGSQIEEGRMMNEFDVIIHNLNRLSRELDSMEALKSDFVSNISHEIKTPITVIQNYIQLLLIDNSLDEAKRREYLEAVLASSRRLSTLVSNILRLTKLEKQEIFRKSDNFSLSDEIAECIFAYDEKIAEKNIDLEVDIEDNVFITSDRELLDIIWNNLISNAVKFTPEGGRIAIRLKVREDGIPVVSVKDNGCGIDQNEIRHIFDKFYQGDSGKKAEGNGLGLALVHRVAVILSADISVKSEKGKGTEFTISLT